MKDSHARILRSILEQPTAPFREEHVAAEIARWAEHRGVPCARDRAGNLLLRHRRGPGRQDIRWVLAAHMDHPGFVITGGRGRRLRARFIGYVEHRYLVGARVRLFTAAGDVCAAVTHATGSPESSCYACRLELDEPAPVPAGTLGMWDLPAMRVRNNRLSGRACDDLVGVAAVLCAFDEIIATGRPADVTGLLTRAEEAWMVGALAAGEDHTLPRDPTVISIETSRAQPHARLGDGVVVRVGDRLRTFDPSVTAHLAAVAGDLSRRGEHFRANRQLMPGGVCEATGYCLAGYPTAAVCLPLGNYHNMGTANRIRPEQIDLRDFESLVTLLAAAATDRRTPAERDDAARKSMRRYLRTHRDWLRGTGRDNFFRPADPALQD